jgi:hypothetical protein
VELSGYPLFLYSATMPRPLHVIKLSDEFGQYEILLTCDCGHTRKCYPQTLARIAGWEVKLDDVVKRVRCSKCGERKCKPKILHITAPRKYTAH